MPRQTLLSAAFLIFRTRLPFCLLPQSHHHFSPPHLESGPRTAVTLPHAAGSHAATHLSRSAPATAGRGCSEPGSARAGGPAPEDGHAGWNLALIQPLPLSIFWAPQRTRAGEARRARRRGEERRRAGPRRAARQALPASSPARARALPRRSPGAPPRARRLARLTRLSAARAAAASSPSAAFRVAGCAFVLLFGGGLPGVGGRGGGRCRQFPGGLAARPDRKCERRGLGRGARGLRGA